MENIRMTIKRRLAALAAAALLLVSLSACAVNMPGEESSSGSESTSSTASESESSSQAPVDVGDYDDTLEGLAEYMKAKGYIEGDPSDMDASFIGAEKGVKYTGSYEGTNNITVELYEYDTANLHDTANAIIDSVKESGQFILMGMTTNATLSDSGKYLMVYTDTVTGEEHDARTAEVKEEFVNFKK